MRLNRYQIIMLILPFVINGVVYMYNETIIYNISHFFSDYKEYANKDLEKKIDIYLKIDAKNKIYNEIEKKIALRDKNAKWIAENVLYEKAEIEQKAKVKQKAVVHKKIKTKVFRLTAVFPKKNLAIINGQIVREKSTINGVKIAKVENHRVLLRYKKGLRWVSLFQ